MWNCIKDTAMKNDFISKLMRNFQLIVSIPAAVTIGMIFLGHLSYSQCTTGAEFGSVFSPSYSGDAEIISDNSGNGFYTKVNILPNRFYTFFVMIPSQLSAGYVDYITITNETGSVVYASGAGVIRWASNANTGVIRYYNHTNSACFSVPTNRRKVMISSEFQCLPPSSAFSASTLNSNSVRLSWADLSPAPTDGYEYYVSSSADFPPNLTSFAPTGVTNVPEVTITNLDNTQGYTWWLRSRCGNICSIWKKAGSFSICTAPPEVSVNNVSNFSATLSWAVPDPVPNEGYQFAYSTTNTLPTSLSSTSQNSVSISNLLSGQLYYYWVRTNCNIDTKSAWVTGSFTTETVYCTNAIYGLRPQTTFSPACTGNWEEISGNSYFGEYCFVNIQPNTNYVFGIDYLEVNGVFIPGYVTITNEDASLNFAGGLSDLEWFSGENTGVIRFYLHRNANCGSRQEGIGKYVKCNGTLGTITREVDLPLIYPNPVSDYMNVSSGSVISEIRVFDLLGHTLMSKTINEKEVMIDLSHFSTGTYFLQVSSEKSSKVYKILKS